MTTHTVTVRPHAAGTLTVTVYALDAEGVGTEISHSTRRGDPSRITAARYAKGAMRALVHGTALLLRSELDEDRGGWDLDFEVM